MSPTEAWNVQYIADGWCNLHNAKRASILQDSYCVTIPGVVSGSILAEDYYNSIPWQFSIFNESQECRNNISMLRFKA